MPGTKRARKPMTEEQQAAYEERRAQMRAITKKIAAMTPEDRMQMAAQVGVVLTCERRALSPFNCCMLVHQRPDVTIVGGFQQWKRVGRMVKKGEHGCYIWIPLGTRETDDQGMTRTDMPDEKRFKLVAVFDVAQTETMEEDA